MRGYDRRAGTWLSYLQAARIWVNNDLTESIRFVFFVSSSNATRSLQDDAHRKTDDTKISQFLHQNVLWCLRSRLMTVSCLISVSCERYDNWTFLYSSAANSDLSNRIIFSKDPEPTAFLLAARIHPYAAYFKRLTKAISVLVPFDILVTSMIPPDTHSSSSRTTF